MSKKNKLVCGIGVNDADYAVTSTVNGKQVMCHFYRVWASMLNRCYSEKFQDKNHTYKGCTVCEEWLTFSNFKKWMEKQDWEGKQLDKDLLIRSNKMYSPTACAFVDKETNLFATDCRASRGEWPVGVRLRKSCKFDARCNNPFTKRFEYLGLFTCPEQAYVAWKKRKHELALQLADLQDDPRVAKALRERYAPDKD